MDEPLAPGPGDSLWTDWDVARRGYFESRDREGLEEVGRLGSCAARRDTKEWSGQVKKPNESDVLQVYPIEGTAQLRFTAKRSKRDADSAAVIAKTWLAGVPTGLFVDNAAQGLYRVKLDPADTSGLTEQTRLAYDVQLKDSTGTFTIDRGTLLVAVDVTITA